MNDTVVSHPRLKVVDLHAGYGRVEILHGVDIELRPGEVVAVLGANGAGKSTLVKAIGGLLDVRRGQIHAFGNNITGVSAPKRARDGVITVPEGRRLFARMSVGENIELGRRLGSRDKSSDDLLQTVLDLMPDIRSRMGVQAGLLSGGQQQLVALARAAAANPKVLLLDEPTLGLSPRLATEVLELVEQISAVGDLSVLLVEQRAKQALSLASRAYVMERGKIMLEGSSGSLMESDEVQRAYLGGRG